MKSNNKRLIKERAKIEGPSLKEVLEDDDWQGLRARYTDESLQQKYQSLSYRDNLYHSYFRVIAEALLRKSTILAVCNNRY